MSRFYSNAIYSFWRFVTDQNKAPPALSMGSAGRERWLIRAWHRIERNESHNIPAPDTFLFSFIMLCNATSRQYEYICSWFFWFFKTNLKKGARSTGSRPTAHQALGRCFARVKRSPVTSDSEPEKAAASLPRETPKPDRWRAP